MMNESRKKTDIEQLHDQAIVLFKGVQICKGSEEGQSINMNMIKVLEALHALVIKEIKDEKS